MLYIDIAIFTLEHFILPHPVVCSISRWRWICAACLVRKCPVMLTVHLWIVVHNIDTTTATNWQREYISNWHLICCAMCGVCDAAADSEVAQSSSDMMSAESSKMSTVSASPSMDTRCCTLCLQCGDFPSVASVRLHMLSVTWLFSILLNSKYCEKFSFVALSTNISSVSVIHF